MYTNTKKQVHLLLDPTEGGAIWDKIINIFLVTLIVLNILAVIIETVDSVYNPYKVYFDGFEYFSICVFTVEYILRLWSCTSIYKYRHPVKGRIRYIFSSGALVDLAAILPFYVPIFFKYDLRFIRILRLIRFFRFFKISRYMNASRIFYRVFQAKKDELLLSMVMTLFLIIVASSLMYFIEHDVQPDKFSSIPETMWWSVATLTTLGYGDMYPITTFGKTMTACISILGIGMFALPAGILASGFADEFQSHKKENRKVCPHCGKEI